jgi:hypothetical protein
MSIINNAGFRFWLGCYIDNRMLKKKAKALVLNNYGNRMYLKGEPPIDLEKIYGVTTFKLG